MRHRLALHLTHERELELRALIRIPRQIGYPDGAWLRAELPWVLHADDYVTPTYWCYMRTLAGPLDHGRKGPDNFTVAIPPALQISALAPLGGAEWIRTGTMLGVPVIAMLAKHRWREEVEWRVVRVEDLEDDIEQHEENPVVSRAVMLALRRRPGAPA